MLLLSIQYPPNIKGIGNFDELFLIIYRKRNLFIQR